MIGRSAGGRADQQVCQALAGTRLREYNRT